MKSVIIIAAILGLTFSCQKENLKKFDGVDYPDQAQTFDVNNNGIFDFELRFSQASSKDEPDTESAIRGRMLELNAGLILPHIGGKTFNLAIGDTIKRPTGPINLIAYDRAVVSRNWDGDKWDAEYTIDAETPNTYILGYLLNDGSTEDLGWVRFDINPVDATVILLEAKQTSADFIVID